MPLHTGKGKTVQIALGRTVDYVENPEKTKDGELISSYECDPLIAEQEFFFSKSQYTALTGRTQGDKDVIAYHLRQSFKPDEIDPQTANKIGYELAMSLTKGKHAFIVCTHVDRKHIHSHIVFNSTALDCTRKFRNFWGSSYAIRKISDKLCLENGLSIIEHPKQAKGHYGKWLGDSKPLNHSDKLRQVIDDALAQKPKTFDEFLQLMQSSGYEAKQGAHVAFKGAEQKKFIRLRSLGAGYSEEGIGAVISGKATHTSIPKQQKKAVNLLVDIQAKLQKGKGAGYEQWAKIFNLKQMASTMNYLREHNLMDLGELDKKAVEVTATFDQLNTQIKSAEKRMKEVNQLKTHIINYMKTKDVYGQYHKSGYSSKYYEQHRGDITLHKAARAHFDSLGLKKLPTVKSLQTEYTDLFAQNKKTYNAYHIAKKEMQELLTAKANVEQILNRTQPRKSQEKTQEVR